MKRILPVVAAVLLAACARDSAAPELAPPSFTLGANPTFGFTTIEPPGARSTTAFGINSAGDVVGAYVDQDFVVHGFLLRQGRFTTIDYPGAEGTQARGISPTGEIVGSYWLPGEPGVNAHGFLLTREGAFLAADYPGHINTIPQRILPNGTILGCRHDNDFTASMVGVVMSPRGNSEISAFASMHNGATPDLRRIVGLYTNTAAGRGEGYVIDDGVFTPLLVPGSSFSAAWDVNPAGDVAGIYRNAAGFHGFVWSAGDFITIDAPGATATRVFGINAGGDVVGSYVAGGKTYGFRASATREHRR